MGELLNIASLELLKSDLELISKIIKESFNETNSIFQSEIVNMRDIRSSIAKLKSELEDELIENSIIRVEQILDDSDKVIVNLQKFVLVLQSLDRLEQMLNGSCKIVKNSLDNSTNRDDVKIA